jgi:hypothetical protein
MKFVFSKFDVTPLKSNNENFQVFWAQKVFGLCLYFLKTLKLFDVTPGQRKINQKCKYKGVFDVRLSQGKIEHPTFFKKRDPNGQKTKIFGFPTIRANIHTCFLPITNVYKTSLSIFNITLKLITCSMLPLFTVPGNFSILGHQKTWV